MNAKLNFKGSDLYKRRLREALATITGLIEMGNEDLWPIFEKLEDEFIRVEQRKSRLSRYYTK